MIGELVKVQLVVLVKQLWENFERITSNLEV